MSTWPNTCRIWEAALRWSLAVILSRSSSTQRLVTLPQPLTNSCKLRVKKDKIQKRLQILAQEFNTRKDSLHTWGHTVRLFHRRRPSRACQSHQTAGQERPSCFEGSGRCRHCWGTWLQNPTQKQFWVFWTGKLEDSAWIAHHNKHAPFNIPLCLLSSLNPSVVNPGRSLLDSELRSTLWVSSSAKFK